MHIYMTHATNFEGLKHGELIMYLIMTETYNVMQWFHNNHITLDNIYQALRSDLTHKGLYY